MADHVVLHHVIWRLRPGLNNNVAQLDRFVSGYIRVPLAKVYNSDSGPVFPVNRGNPSGFLGRRASGGVWPKAVAMRKSSSSPEPGPAKFTQTDIMGVSELTLIVGAWYILQGGSRIRLGW